MSEITITLHKLSVLQVTAVLAAIGGAKYELGQPAQVLGHHVEPDDFKEPNPAGAFAASAAVGGYVPPQAAYVHPTFTPAVVASIDQANTDADTYKPFDPNVAAGVFGAKVVQQVESLQGVYAPQGAVVMAPPLVSNQPASSAGGGTPASVDTKGREWDARIHSSSKEKLAKTGEWKLKRGVDKALVAQVEAELDGRTVVAPQGVTRFNDQVVQHGAPATTPHPQQGYYAPPVPTGPQYADVVATITAAIAGGKVMPNVAAGMLNHYQIADIADLERHPDKWQTVIAEINRLSGAQ